MNNKDRIEKEKWLRLAAVYEDLNIDILKQELWSGNISLRGVFIEDRSIAMNDERPSVLVPNAFIKAAFRSELLDQAFDTEWLPSPFYPKLGMLCANEFPDSDDGRPDHRAYCDLEISERDYKYVLRLGQKRKRGRPTLANYDFIEEYVKKNAKLLREMSTDTQRYKFIREEHLKKYNYAPSQTTMLRRVKPMITKYVE